MNTAAQTQKPTLLEELTRWNRVITDCENTLNFMRRRGASLHEIFEVEEKLKMATCERDWLEGCVLRPINARAENQPA